MSRPSPTPFPGLVEYRRRATTTVVVGAVAFVAGLALMEVNEGAGATSVVMALVFGIGMGTTGLMRIARIRRLGQRQGWRLRDARFRVVGGGNGQPALVLDATPEEPEAVLSVSTTVFRWGALHGASRLWVTGDPTTRFAAVATEAFDSVLVVKRPLFSPWRTRLRNIATGEP